MCVCVCVCVRVCVCVCIQMATLHRFGQRQIRFYTVMSLCNVTSVMINGGKVSKLYLKIYF